MSVGLKDAKILWGLAAGRCGYPGCAKPCIRYLSGDEPTILGEMAHIIAQSQGGPRGGAQVADNTYNNLILLCPTHHREIDKAPDGAFPAEMLRAWKAKHESNISEALQAPKFDDLQSWKKYVGKLLAENKKIWKTYGPESEEALGNPGSNLSKIWVMRKISMLVPNNRQIINSIISNKDIFDQSEYEVCCEFIEHAEAFEQNCYERIENAPRFPTSFEDLVR